MTIIRLLDGTRVYLHAVIDNFSRRILTWKLAQRIEPQTTCAVLSKAAAGLDLKTCPATVVADSGVENVNLEIDELIGLGHLRRVLAQVEVTFSNSMIEAWWRSLKHNWLFLNTLDTFASVERLVAFYVEQHNSVMPHCAFRGQTPDEVYFATGAETPPSSSPLIVPPKRRASASIALSIVAVAHPSASLLLSRNLQSSPTCCSCTTRTPGCPDAQQGANCRPGIATHVLT